MFKQMLVITILLEISRAEVKEAIIGDSKSIIKRTIDIELSSLMPTRVKNVIDRIENRRRKIKKAFYKFISEAFFDEEVSKRISEVRSDVGIEYSLSIAELIVLHGYRVESHNVLTKDGYMLALQRILPTNENRLKEGKLALLHHGLLGSSDDWILLGPNKSLPYLLSDFGYDIWLANARGNRYSRIHTSRNVNSHEFWDFSWHEIGAIDLATVIDFIIENTQNRSHINFIGHSMGATALLVLLSIHPEYNNVIRSAILLAPLVFMYHIKGPLRTIAKYESNHKDDTLALLGNKEFMPIVPFPPKLMEQFCKGGRTLCDNLLLLISTGGQNINNVKVRKNVLAHLPAGGSTRTIIHYGQLVMSGMFQQFDHGMVVNLKTYGLRSPPSYHLANVTTPVTVISSSDDWLSTGPDIGTLLHSLPNAFVHHVVKKSNFSHMDFILSEEAVEYVYSLVLDSLE